MEEVLQKAASLPSRLLVRGSLHNVSLWLTLGKHACKEVSAVV